MKTQRETRSVEHYLQLNYPITVYRDEEGGYVAELEDLPGCITQGETLEEVEERIEEARRIWIQAAYEDDVKIPIPRTDEEYSGRFVVRILKSLHHRLAEQSIREGVSLNQYVETILTAGVTRVDMKSEIKEVLTKILGRQLVTEGTLGFRCQTGYIDILQWTAAGEKELRRAKNIEFLKVEEEAVVAL